MFNHSEKLDELAAALVLFQSKVRGVFKSATNDSAGNNYADLTSILGEIREPLTDCGLSLVQIPGAITGGMKVSVETIIFHSSGQFISLLGEMPLDRGQDAWAAGSAFSYLRRYAVLGVFSLPTFDDDGSKAAGRNGGVKAIKKEVMPNAGDSPVHATAPRQSNPTEGAKLQTIAPTGETIDETDEQEAARLKLHGPKAGLLTGLPLDAKIETLTKAQLETLARDRLPARLHDQKWARLIIQRFGEYIFLGELDDELIERYAEEAPEYARPAIEEWSKSRAPAPDPQVCPLSQDFRKVFVPSGTNEGVPIDNLSSEDIARYEAETLPAIKAKIDAGVELAPEFLDFYHAMVAFKAWREWSPELPINEPVQQAKKQKLKKESTEAQKELKARKDLPKRPKTPTSPATGAESPDGASTPPEKEKPVTANLEAKAGLDWRKYVLPIGKPFKEGGNKGCPLGMLSLETIQKIKTQYLDKRQWDRPEFLKHKEKDNPDSFSDWELKAAVEAAIANNGKPAPVKLPDGPVADLYARLDGFAIDPEGEFLPKMVAMEKLPKGTEKFHSIDPATAQAMLENWEQTLADFESEFQWEGEK